jgi:mono/diheme cytochrome c family protein
MKYRVLTAMFCVTMWMGCGASESNETGSADVEPTSDVASSEDTAGDASDGASGDVAPADTSETPQDVASDTQDVWHEETSPVEVSYVIYCATCHGEDGLGTSLGPAILHELHHTDEELVAVILNGKGSMASVDVSPEVAQAIVDYLRNVLDVQ